MSSDYDLFIRGTLSNYRELREYACRLVADLSDADMVRQPDRVVPAGPSSPSSPLQAMNHAAWILSHLAAYAPVVAAILRAEPAYDPLNHEHGRNSAPVSDPAAYLPKAELIAHYCRVYDDAAAALETCPPARLLEPTPIERWRPRFPIIADLPVQFLVKHNATHLGQLSAWRRACGWPGV